MSRRVICINPIPHVDAYKMISIGRIAQQTTKMFGKHTIDWSKVKPNRSLGVAKKRGYEASEATNEVTMKGKNDLVIADVIGPEASEATSEATLKGKNDLVIAAVIGVTLAPAANTVAKTVSDLFAPKPRYAAAKMLPAKAALANRLITKRLLRTQERILKNAEAKRRNGGVSPRIGSNVI